jgi:hypothetical protein
MHDTPLGRDAFPYALQEGTVYKCEGTVHESTVQETLCVAPGQRERSAGGLCHCFDLACTRTSARV